MCGLRGGFEGDSIAEAFDAALEGAFGSDIDYAMLVKIYGPSSEGETFILADGPAQSIIDEILNFDRLERPRPCHATPGDRLAAARRLLHGGPLRGRAGRCHDRASKPDFARRRSQQIQCLSTKTFSSCRTSNERLLSSLSGFIGRSAAARSLSGHGPRTAPKARVGECGCRLSFVWPRCARRSDTVRRVEYQFLHINSVRRIVPVDDCMAAGSTSMVAAAAAASTVHRCPPESLPRWRQRQRTGARTQAMVPLQP